MRFLATVPGAILFAFSATAAEKPPAADLLPGKPSLQVAQLSPGPKRAGTPVIAAEKPPTADLLPEKPPPKVTQLSQVPRNAGTPVTAAEQPPGADPLPEKPPLKVTQLSLVPRKADTPGKVIAEKKRQSRRLASLGDSIILRTSGDLAGYLDYAVTQNKPMTLFLNGNDTLVTPERTDTQKSEVQFRLERNADNKKVWAALLRDPFHNSERHVEASVGLASSRAEPAINAWFTLNVFQTAWWVSAWLVLLLACLLVFGWLVAKHDLLRDGRAPSPFSLGRCQMAWWFFLIIVAYVLIWIVSGEQDTITPSLLVLMGISAATALGAVLIDSADGGAALSQAATDRLALLAAQQNAEQRVVAAQAAETAAPADPVAQKNLEDARAAVAIAGAKLLVVNNRLNGIVTVPQTRGALRDILVDSTGAVGLHRLQIVVWTIVLGIIFMVSVVMELRMPEFSTTLLAAMGISAGTYLGFKFPEK